MSDISLHLASNPLPQKANHSPSHHAADSGETFDSSRKNALKATLSKSKHTVSRDHQQLSDDDDNWHVPSHKQEPLNPNHFLYGKDRASADSSREHHQEHAIDTTNDMRKRKKKTSIKDFIRPEDLQYRQQGEQYLKDLSSEFAVNSSRDVLFSNVKFADLDGTLSKGLLKNVTQFMNLERMTYIQEKSFKPILSGSDVLVKSETGSGKTLAYLLPIIQNLFGYSRKNPIKRDQGTYAIVIAPTRELCIQIQKVADVVSTCFPWMVTSSIMGGERTQKEKKRLKKGVTLLIATPGRLEDHMKNTKAFKYGKLRHIVLDEADRLLDMGFEPTLKTVYHMFQSNGIVSDVDKPQTVLVSATLTSKIRQLANWTLRDEVYAGFTKEELNQREESLKGTHFSIPEHLTQHYMTVPCKLRIPTLLSFLVEKTSKTAMEMQGQKKASKIIVFLSCCNSVDFHHQLLSSATTKQKVVGPDGGLITKKERVISVKMYKLHGDMPQAKRTKVYFDFLNADEGILFCTDVAARGLDMPKTDWIVQYDTPGEPREYLHRVGRTARLGFQGNACLFLMPHEQLYVKLLRKYGIELSKLNTELSLENLAFLAHEKSNDIFEMSNSVQIQMEDVVKNSERLHLKAARAFQDFVKSYATHSKNTKFIFHPKNLHLGHVATAFCLKETPSELKELTRRSSKLDQKKDDVADELTKRGFDVELRKKRRGGKLNIHDVNQISERNISRAPKRSKMSLTDRIKQYKSFEENPNQGDSVRPKIDVKSILSTKPKAVASAGALRNSNSFSQLLEKNKRKREDSTKASGKPAKRTKFTY